MTAFNQRNLDRALDYGLHGRHPTEEFLTLRTNQDLRFLHHFRGRH